MDATEVKQRFCKIEGWLRQLREVEATEGNTAQIKNLRDKSLIEFFKLENFFSSKLNNYDERRFSDIFLNEFYKFIEYIIKSYDGNGPLENFVNYTWAKRKMRVYEYMKKEAYVSLDEQISDEAEVSRYEIIKDESEAPEEKVIVNDMANIALLQMATAINAMFAHSGVGKKNNPTREKYFRLIYTEKMTHIVKTAELFSEEVKHEKQVMNTCNLEFLDFYMKEICRTISNVNQVPLKMRNEIGIEKKGEEEIDFPFPDKLYQIFFKQYEEKDVSASILSQNRTKFKGITDSLKAELH